MAAKPKFPVLNIILLAAAAVVLVIAFKFSKGANKPLSILPYYGPKHYNPVTKDTVYHTVLNFHLTDQMGQPVTLDTFSHKIFVANFFFASCPGICKKMNSELEWVTHKFAHNPNVKFVSYTVDPMRDSVPVLAEYAKLHNAIPYQWYFLTGNKDSIYNLAWKSYYSAVHQNGVNFVHSSNLALVDRHGHIRGFYQGTDSADIVRMIADIHALLKEN